MYFNIQAVNCEIKIPGKMSPDYNITQNYMKFINQMFFQKLFSVVITTLLIFNYKYTKGLGEY